ncbi:MAG: hypothetical protein GEV07_30780 [Streptosporangiales bacterium]|nr:hypothetical protein [Streptosporangiales bacterium]
MDSRYGPQSVPGRHVPRPPWERPAIAGAPPPPAPPRSRHKRRSAWLAGVLVVVLLVWFGGVAAFRTGVRLPSVPAAEFVPPDGQRHPAKLQQAGTRSQATVENAWVRGKYIGVSVSPFLYRYMVPPPDTPRSQVEDVRWWREAVLPGDSQQAPRYRVFSITDGGIRLHGQDWGQLGRVS